MSIEQLLEDLVEAQKEANLLKKIELGLLPNTGDTVYLDDKRGAVEEICLPSHCYIVFQEDVDLFNLKDLVRKLDYYGKPIWQISSCQINPV